MTMNPDLAVVLLVAVGCATYLLNKWLDRKS